MSMPSHSHILNAVIPTIILVKLATSHHSASAFPNRHFEVSRSNIAHDLAVTNGAHLPTKLFLSKISFHELFSELSHRLVALLLLIARLDHTLVNLILNRALYSPTGGLLKLLECLVNLQSFLYILRNGDMTIVSSAYKN